MRVRIAIPTLVIAAVTLTGCGATITLPEAADTTTNTTESAPEPETQPEPTTDVAPDGFNADSIVEAMAVCMDAAQKSAAASDGPPTEASIHNTYAVTAREWGECGNAMEQAGEEITDPGLSPLWDDTVDAVDELVRWTDLGWTGTVYDLERTLELTAEVVDALEDVADWSTDNLDV